MDERQAYVQAVTDLRCFLQTLPSPDTAGEVHMADCLRRLATLLETEAGKD